MHKRSGKLCWNGQSIFLARVRLDVAPKLSSFMRESYKNEWSSWWITKRTSLYLTPTERNVRSHKMRMEKRYKGRSYSVNMKSRHNIAIRNTTLHYLGSVNPSIQLLTKPTKSEKSTFDTNVLVFVHFSILVHIGRYLWYAGPKGQTTLHVVSSDWWRIVTVYRSTFSCNRNATWN